MTIYAFNEREMLSNFSALADCPSTAHASVAVAGVNRAGFALQNRASCDFVFAGLGSGWAHVLFKKYGVVTVDGSTQQTGYMMSILDADGNAICGLFSRGEGVTETELESTYFNWFGSGDLTNTGGVLLDDGTDGLGHVYDFYWEIDGTSGTLRVYKDTVLVHQVTGVDTQPGTATTATTLRFAHRGNAAAADDDHRQFYSHVIVRDTNTINMRVFTHSLLTESGGTDWDGDIADINGTGLTPSTAMSADTVNDTSTFTHDDLPALAANEEIVAVIVSTYSDYSINSPVQTQNGAAYVGTTMYHTAGIGLDEDAPKGVQHVFETNPATAEKWTRTEVNDTEFGFRATA